MIRSWAQRMTTEQLIQIVIPMAGRGMRFLQTGYKVPKPLLPIHGQPMFSVVMANLLTDDIGRVVVIAQKQFGLRPIFEKLQRRVPQSLELIEIDYVTGGPADTVELAIRSLEADLPVVTANSDQFVNHSLSSFYNQVRRSNNAGFILTMKDDDPKWSYALTDLFGRVKVVREKEVISRDATVGIYGFRSAALMWEAFDSMRAAKESVNGEYYVGPAYNQLIKRGRPVVAFDIGEIKTVMHGMGTPEDYEAFLCSPVSVHAAEQSCRLFGTIIID